MKARLVKPWCPNHDPLDLMRDEDSEPAKSILFESSSYIGTFGGAWRKVFCAFEQHCEDISRESFQRRVRNARLVL
jgi:hypothetical protein